MAILVTEEGVQKVPIATVFLWLAVLLVTAAAVYYVFFREVETTVDVGIPPNYRNIDPLATMTLDPLAVVNSEPFRSLRQYVALPAPGNAGRQNPFIVVP